MKRKPQLEKTATTRKTKKTAVTPKQGIKWNERRPAKKAQCARPLSKREKAPVEAFGKQLDKVVDGTIDRENHLREVIGNVNKRVTDEIMQVRVETDEFLKNASDQRAKAEAESDRRFNVQAALLGELTKRLDNLEKYDANNNLRKPERERLVSLETWQKTIVKMLEQDKLLNKNAEESLDRLMDRIVKLEQRHVELAGKHAMHHHDIGPFGEEMEAKFDKVWKALNARPGTPEEDKKHFTMPRYGATR